MQLANTMALSKQKIVYLLIPFLVCISPFFFLWGPNYLSSRSFKYFWDLGHIFYFMLFSYAFAEFFLKKKFNLSAGKLFYVVFAVTFFLGLFIEYGQLLMSGGRSPDLYDVARNQFGCLLAFSFFVKPLFLTNKALRFALYGLLPIAAVSAVLPFSGAIFDEAMARRKFPVLSDFETPFEKSRWVPKGGMTMVQDVVRNGRVAASVQLSTEEYSGVSLFYFPHDWSGYRWLHFSINNPTSDTFEIICRINDSKHRELGQQYADRFNRNYWLRPGWNDVAISLDEVEQAPAGRKMDLTTIELLGLFVMNQSVPRIIYIDNFFLSR